MYNIETKACFLIGCDVRINKLCILNSRLYLFELSSSEALTLELALFLGDSEYVLLIELFME